ncbi:UDP-4-amino-4,6-dideoxy-N-acetyl-beta-L-altrosamine transaminase [Demequina aurantiaca]|uniref:UDP-4-amino-4, 6-dideoxy-N-acetyl-beta-L-altrosamine transaminase n=1 Tax=Demequina aurantiaca TaxID=676200 RepID=UPI0007816931|nr:UDP-4-amino-4,6-dideoxy-N-acetyl-beta-L-altrosamine transaminase [Demequina aurantiaca]
MTSEPFIPYGRQIIDDDDLQAVADVLQGDWLTTGPKVGEFEKAFAEYVEAPHAVAVNSGTAALHLAMLAAGVGEGDEVIVSSLTFVASANAAVYVGATVVFADIDPRTWTIDHTHVRSLVTDRTKAIVAVDYAGAPCDLGPLRDIADEFALVLIEDACHAPGAVYQGRRIGSIADFTAFSFHPVKHITTGEGGMVTTLTGEHDRALRTFRSHGIATDFRSREASGTWEYDQVALGYNYRIPDITCALGITQLGKQGAWLDRRRQIAVAYGEAFAGVPNLETQHVEDDRTSAWHLYPVRIIGENAASMRASVFSELRDQGIGVNVHYRPVYEHSYYRDRGYESGLCPNAEAVYSGLLSLPMWPGLTDSEQDRVIHALIQALVKARNGQP